MMKLRSPSAYLSHLFAIPPGTLSPRFWLGLSLLFAIGYSLLGLRLAFSGDYVIQDDARQHVFWMQRFIDPLLLPHDLITDYYQSLAPKGYAALYRGFAMLGINPLLLSKLLPPFLGAISTIYCFNVVLQLLPVPFAGFITSVLLNQTLWMVDDLASATPRAFTYPLFFAFLYYLLRWDGRRSLLGLLLPFLIALVLLVQFYPTYALVAIALLFIFPLEWRQGRLHLCRDRRFWFCLSGLAVCLVGVLQYALSSSAFGPTISVAEAKTLVEFQPDGQYAFFLNNPIDFWLFGRKGSGYFSPSLFTPVTLLAGLFLPVVLKFPGQFPLVRLVSSKVSVLPRIIIAATGVFLLAHLLLFRLYLPNRYTDHSLRMVLCLAAGLCLSLVLDGLFHYARAHRVEWQSLVAGVGMGVIVVAIICYPAFVKIFPTAGYLPGLQPDLYQFFAQQPKDSLVASFSEEASNLPTFAARPVLVAREYAIPFHVGYYHPMRQRLADLIRTQYSPSLDAVKAFNQRYTIAFWLVDKTAFSPDYLLKNNWRKQYRGEVAEAIAHLQQATPALQAAIPRCTVFENASLVVLKAECLNQLQ